MQTDLNKVTEVYSCYESTRFTPNPNRARVWREILFFLEKRFGVPKAFLELGAGYCDAINASRATRKFALDIRPEVRLHAQLGVNVHIGSCADLSWLTPEKMDWVLASNLFEHLSRDILTATLAAIARILSNDGLLLIIQPNFRYCYRSYFDDYTHLPEAVMTDTSMADFLTAAGFEVVHKQPRFLPFSLKSRLPTRSLLVRMYLHSPLKPFAGQMLFIAKRHHNTTNHGEAGR